jgi:hypothetical protein
MGPYEQTRNDKQRAKIILPAVGGKRFIFMKYLRMMLLCTPSYDSPVHSSSGVAKDGSYYEEKTAKVLFYPNLPSA